MKLSRFSRSFLNALGTALYTGAVASFLANGEHLFKGVERTFLVPLFMLLLLIISATVTGFLVLGRPLELYLAGERREGLLMLVVTILWLILFALLILSAVAIF